MPEYMNPTSLIGDDQASLRAACSKIVQAHDAGLGRVRHVLVARSLLRRLSVYGPSTCVTSNQLEKIYIEAEFQTQLLAGGSAKRS